MKKVLELAYDLFDKKSIIEEGSCSDFILNFKGVKYLFEYNPYVGEYYLLRCKSEHDKEWSTVFSNAGEKPLMKFLELLKEV